MTTPLRVDCPSIDAIPPVEVLREWATYEYHVVLHFPAYVFNGRPTTAKSTLIARLNAEMPDHKVFDGGCLDEVALVTIRRVISADYVRANASAFLDALRLYRRIATSLALKLAGQLGVVADRLWQAAQDQQAGVGQLDAEWDYRFHGLECGFVRRSNGQEVEVRLEFGSEFGAIDPYFFARFVRTTSGLANGVRFHDNFHDAARVLEVFDREGYLRTVDGRFGHARVVRDEVSATEQSNEIEWHTCRDARHMLDLLRGRVSNRKLRLFACACCRGVWRLLPDKGAQRAVEMAERYADDSASESERIETLAANEEEAEERAKLLSGSNPDELWLVRYVYRAANLALAEDIIVGTDMMLSDIARAEGVELSLRNGQKEPVGDQFCVYLRQLQAPYCDPLRCIFGNPVQQVVFDSSWRSETAILLAKQMYESRDFSDLPILADALMESGCDSEAILSHCRSEGPHARGCFVIDLILGKQ